MGRVNRDHVGCCLEACIASVGAQILGGIWRTKHKDYLQHFPCAGSGEKAFIAPSLHFQRQARNAPGRTSYKLYPPPKKTKILESLNPKP